MKRIATVLIGVAAGMSWFACLGQSAPAAPAPDATVWKKGVPPTPDARADFGNHVMSISHRSANGKAEVHKTKADVMVIQSGTATLVTGGEVVGGVDTAPNEIQGASIKGGTTHTLNVGDVVEVPAGVPHQFLLAPGTQITYLLVKINKS